MERQARVRRYHRRSPNEARDGLNRGLILDALLTGRTISGDVSDLRDMAREYVEKSGLIRTQVGYVHRV